MADVNVSAKIAAPASGLAERPGATPTPAEPVWDIIELLFFAYRAFVGDPDEVLSKLAFGRAHHRVLHFVNRNPGMKVADLLEILNITKQSLGRVLKQLVDQGFVVQKEGAQDRRQRLLYVTPKGETLALKLAGLQTQRINRAFFLHYEALIDQLLEHAAERLFGDVEDLQQVGDLHAGIAVDEMQHPVMGTPEGELGEHLVRIADEIAIGEEQQLDDVPDRLGRRRRGARALGQAARRGGNLGAHIYVSHVDIFWFYVTKRCPGTKGSCRNGLFFRQCAAGRR